jgi:RNA recognition motif-containing protein
MINLSAIIEKMNKLKLKDKNFSLFGSDLHRYKLNDTLSEKDLLEYEKQYGLVLPKEYREFLLYAGDGGCGPFYGLLPLRDNSGELKYEDSNGDDRGLDKDFPFTRSNPFYLNDDGEPAMFDEYCDKYKELIALDELRNKYYEEGKLDEEEHADNAHAELENFFYEQATQGVKFLCHEGCGMYNVLVMRGEEAGTIWHLDFSGGGGWIGILPLINPDNNQPLGFFDWYNIS